jgi:K+ transporter
VGAAAALLGAPGAAAEARALARGGCEPHVSVTFILNRLSIADRGGHSWFTQLRIRLYRLLVTNARDARGVFGLPASGTIEVCSVRLL